MSRRPAASASLFAVTALAAALLAGCGAITQPVGRYRGASPLMQNVTVMERDTVYELARRHNVSVRALIEANGLRPPYQLYPGQTIYLPPMAEHLVVAGDTVSAVAKQYGVAARELIRANGLQAPYTIRVGQRLRLPKAVEQAEASPTVAVMRAPPTGFLPPPLPPPAAPDPELPAPVQDAPSAKPAAPVPGSAMAGGFIWPAQGEVIARFGPQGKGQHNDGINIALPLGAPVRAAADGVVAYAGNELRGFGNMLLIRHGDGWMTAYAHNEQLLVKRGAVVRRGEVIARAGATGNVRAPQLHFEVRRGAQPVDPLAHLSQARAAAEEGGYPIRVPSRPAKS